MLVVEEEELGTGRAWLAAFCKSIQQINKEGKKKIRKINKIKIKNKKEKIRKARKKYIYWCVRVCYLSRSDGISGCPGRQYSNDGLEVGSKGGVGSHEQSTDGAVHRPRLRHTPRAARTPAPTTPNCVVLSTVTIIVNSSSTFQDQSKCYGYMVATAPTTPYCVVLSIDTIIVNSLLTFRD